MAHLIVIFILLFFFKNRNTESIWISYIVSVIKYLNNKNTSKTYQETRITQTILKLQLYGDVKSVHF